VRAGLMTAEEFLGSMSSAIADLQKSPGRLNQSLEQSSAEVWTNSNSGVGASQATVSYYGKGNVVAFLLDTHIRRLTNGAQSLDDGIRLAYSRYGGARGFTAAELRATFEDLKRNIGIDPASIEYLAIAVRFQKPAADLSFVPPDLLAVLSGDFSADSMLTLLGLYLQDQARTETYRSKTITLVKVDPIVKAAEKTPMLKAFTELGVVALNSNTLAIGNTAYLKAAVDASEGEGRINATSLNSLLRNPNALISAAGSPLTAFIKSFGLLGTQTAPREASCLTRFGDFYAAVTVEGTNFSLRGAMNTDNPETAKIIHGLISSLLEPAISSVPDKEAQSILKSIKMSPRENEIVLEADVSHETIAKFVREQTQPKATTPTTSTTPTAKPTPKPKPKPKRRVRRK
jgi:hypothetical protein